MAQTLVKLYVHIIFSTKKRGQMIMPEIEDELFAYLGGIANNHNSKLISANGTANHLHLLISLSKNIELSVLVGHLKRDSSKWLKTKDERLKGFLWQDGYSAFSVGYTQVEDVKKYIANQKLHHTNVNFEDELRYFLRKYDLEFDEQYIWD